MFFFGKAEYFLVKLLLQTATVLQLDMNFGIFGTTDTYKTFLTTIFYCDNGNINKFTTL